MSGSGDRAELAAFLRSRRERIAPEGDLEHRRTPGLRREEVAELAHISTIYYTQLEQARGASPSLEVLGAVADALQLAAEERDHVLLLAGLRPRTFGEAPRIVRRSIQDLLDRLPSTAAFVVSAVFDVLAWNPLAAALMEDFAAVPVADRNLARRAFLGPAADGRWLYGVTDLEEFRRHAAARLRVKYAQYPEDPAVIALVADLLRSSVRFARLWDSHDVAAEAALTKTFEHPDLGPIAVDCDVLELPDRDQRLVLYTAPPGSQSAAMLESLGRSS